LAIVCEYAAARSVSCFTPGYPASRPNLRILWQSLAKVEGPNHAAGAMLGWVFDRALGIGRLISTCFTIGMDKSEIYYFYNQ
jgi:hypothetical protein